MKNVIKKITAAAMAFTLLGAGGSIAKSAKPAASNTLTASAAHTCYCKYDRNASYVRNGYVYCCSVYRCTSCGSEFWYVQQVHHV